MHSYRLPVSGMSLDGTRMVLPATQTQPPPWLSTNFQGTCVVYTTDNQALPSPGKCAGSLFDDNRGDTPGYIFVSNTGPITGQVPPGAVLSYVVFTPSSQLPGNQSFGARFGLQGQQVRQAPGQIARFGQQAQQVRQAPSQQAQLPCTGSFPNDTCKGDSYCVAGACVPGPGPGQIARFGQQGQQVRQAPGQIARFGQQETCTVGDPNSCSKGDLYCVDGVCTDLINPCSPSTLDGYCGLNSYCDAGVCSDQSFSARFGL